MAEDGMAWELVAPANRRTVVPRGGRVAACGAALALGCLCVGLLGGRASSSPSRSALLDGGAATLSGGEAWYAANKDYGTDGTEAGVNMVDWYPQHKNVSDQERTWWQPHKGKQADLDWYTQHLPSHAAQAASISRHGAGSERHALKVERKRRQQMLYGAAGHWGGVGSENYGTPSWDNSGWNAHVSPCPAYPFPPLRSYVVVVVVVVVPLPMPVSIPPLPRRLVPPPLPVHRGLPTAPQSIVLLSRRPRRGG